MPYQRKTYDLYDIIGHYPDGKEVVTTEVSWKDTRMNLKAYRENEPETRFTWRRYRERIPKD